MSMMCKMSDKCCATKGMCIHEKMMLTIVMALVFAGAWHWLPGWF
jgi:hypothetical protein